MPYYQFRGIGGSGDLYWVFADNETQARGLADPDAELVISHQTTPPTGKPYIINDPNRRKDTGTDNGMEGATEGDYLELAAPEAAFRRYLRDLGLGPSYPGTAVDGVAPTQFRPTLRQQAAQAQYEPLSALFTGRQLMGTADPREEDEVAREQMFRTFLKGIGTEEGVIPRATPGALQRTFGQFADIPDIPQPGVVRPVWQQMATRPQTVSEGRPLANLGLQALRSTISPLALRYFNLPSQEELTTRYLSGPAAGVQNYAKFLRAQLGIPA